MGDSDASSPAEPTPPPETPKPPETPEQRRNKLVFIGAGAGFLLLVVILVLVFVFLQDNDDATPSASGATAPPVGSSGDFSALPSAVTHVPLLWLRADAIPGTPGPVGTWSSSSAGGLAASQTTPQLQPTSVTSAIGGRPAVKFDGATTVADADVLVANLNINPSALPSVTIVSVFSSDVGEVSTPLRKLYGADDQSFDRAAGLDTRGGGRNYVVFGGPSIGVIGYFNLFPETTYLTVDQFGAGTFNGWVQGVHVVDDAGTTSGQGLTSFYIGGTGTVFLEPWQGEIAEMLVFEGSLTDAERIALENFLAGKYRIELYRS